MIDGKQNIFKSSLFWLLENSAITFEEFQEILELKEHRNLIAHNIDKIITDSDFNIDVLKEKRIFELITKIELWWIREVEIPTNPDYINKNINDGDIISGKEVFFNYIKSITAGLIKKKTAFVKLDFTWVSAT